MPNPQFKLGPSPAVLNDLLKWGIGHPTNDWGKLKVAYLDPDQTFNITRFARIPAVMFLYSLPNGEAIQWKQAPLYRMRWLVPIETVSPNMSGKYWQPKGSSSHLYFPLNQNYNKQYDQYMIVEGEKKALVLAPVANTLGIMVLGIGGHSMWAGGKSGAVFNPELSLLLPNIKTSKKVWLLPDTNIWSNPAVNKGWQSLANALHREGCKPVLLDLRGAQITAGNTDMVNGPDDWLLKGNGLNLPAMLGKFNKLLMEAPIEAQWSLIDEALDDIIINLQTDNIYIRSIGRETTLEKYNSTTGAHKRIDDGKKSVPVGTLVVQSPLRREAHGYHFDPSTTEDLLTVDGVCKINSFIGFNVHPETPGREFIKRWTHVTKSLLTVHPEGDMSGYVHDIIAYKLQYPERQVAYMPILIGPEGIGKTAFLNYIGRLLSPYTVRLGGSFFNEDKDPEGLDRALFLVGEDIHAYGREGVQRLRRLVGNKEYAYRRMYHGSTTIQSRWIVILAGNEIDNFVVTEGNRRPWPLKLDAAMKNVVAEGDLRFTDWIRKEFEWLEQESMLRQAMGWYLDRNVEQFNPVVPPIQTEAYNQAVEATEPAEYGWVRRVLEPIGDVKKEGAILFSKDLKAWAMRDVERADDQFMRKALRAADKLWGCVTYELQTTRARGMAWFIGRYSRERLSGVVPGAGDILDRTYAKLSKPKY